MEQRNYNAEEGDVFYPMKGHFKEYFDGWDNYYIFDQSKSVEWLLEELKKEHEAMMKKRKG